MRTKILGLLTLSIFGVVFVACGQAVGSADLAGAPNSAATGPTGNFDDDGTGGAGQGPTKAQPSTLGQSSSGGSSSSGKPNPMLPSGCIDPGNTQTKTMFMTVPNANWFASATQARGNLLNGVAPDPAEVRDADFLAYYAVKYGGANVGGGGLTAFPLIGPAPSKSLYQVVLQVGAQSAPLGKDARPPTALTFVVDTSISMTGRSMKLAVRTMQAAVTNLGAGDSVNVVTTSASAEPLKLTVAVAGDPKVASVLGGMEADGGDDIPGALARAYEVAQSSYKAHGLNRVVFITDGGAPPNLIDAKLLRTQAEPGAHGDIRLVGVGVGDPGGYIPALLERAAGAGKGALLFVDSEKEATATLGGRFDEVMNVAAADVKLQVEYPWYMTPDEPENSGVISGDPTQIVPAELGPGGSMTFRQIMRLCGEGIIDVYPADQLLGVKLTWLSPDGAPLSFGASPLVTAINGASATAKVDKTTAVLAYADALRSLEPTRIKAAQKRIAILSAMQNDPDLIEIAGLLTMHPLYKKP